MDDRAGRREASRRSLPVQGTLGLLETAAVHGLINLPEAMERLRRTNFRVAPALMKAILERAAE